MEPTQIKVLIADDHALFLDGLKLLIETDPGLKVVAEAENGKELLSKVESMEPDVVVTDIMMPGVNGIEAIKIINQSGGTPCIALSTFDDESLIMDAIDAGAMGYMLKNAQKGEIIEGIKTVNKYQPYYCRAIETKIVKIISKRKTPEIQSTRFTERELMVIRLISKEVSSEEIARKIFVSKRTVDGIRAKLLEKMNVKSSIGVLHYALTHKLFTLEDINQEK